MRQNIKVHLEPSVSPCVWVRAVLREADAETVEQVQKHLVEAQLQIRFPERTVPNYPGHAGNVQTGKSGDVELDSVSYHVTANPGWGVIEKCRASAVGNRPPRLAGARRTSPKGTGSRRS